MKTTNIYIIVLTLLLSVPVQAQTASTSGANELFDGLVNTLHDVKDDVIETANKVKDKLNDVRDKNKENIEKLEFALKFRTGDIKLIMKKNKDVTEEDMTLIAVPISKQGDMFGYREFLTDASLSVEFDWDNRALKMVGKSKSNAEMGILGYLGGSDIQIDKEENITQYTDKDGNWYTPVEDMEGFEDKRYIKFNAKQMAVDRLRSMIDIDIEVLANKLEMIVRYLEQLIDWDREYAGGLLGYRLQDLIKSEDALDENLNEAIKAILSKELEEIGGFPIFIHWAFKYSPEAIKKYYGNKVSETKLDCDGYTNACSKFKVLQGPDKGKSMSFDRLGRLTFINSLKEGTAKFFYDRDITVTLPDPNEVITLSSMMGKIRGKQKQQEEQTKKEQEEAKKRATEELAKRKKKELISKIELKIYKEEADIADLEKELRKPRPKSESDSIKKEIEDKKTKVKQYKGMIETLKKEINPEEDTAQTKDNTQENNN